jgi:hypothetical protein
MQFVAWNDSSTQGKLQPYALDRAEDGGLGENDFGDVSTFGGKS